MVSPIVKKLMFLFTLHLCSLFGKMMIVIDALTSLRVFIKNIYLLVLSFCLMYPIVWFPVHMIYGPADPVNPPVFIEYYK